MIRHRWLTWMSLAFSPFSNFWDFASERDKQKNVSDDASLRFIDERVESDRTLSSSFFCRSLRLPERKCGVLSAYLFSNKIDGTPSFYFGSYVPSSSRRSCWSEGEKSWLSNDTRKKIERHNPLINEKWRWCKNTFRITCRNRKESVHRIFNIFL